ncbi:hydrolase [Thozetella sp. PMI_491]|nr:hydrolase [Thozetella sp. PMI_491]
MAHTLTQKSLARASIWLHLVPRRHAGTMSTPISHTIRLPDGRTLGYAEFGHPDGTPLFYFHGYPSSRLEARATDALARKRHIRVIAPDRPGFGLSTFQPGRLIMDWPADIRALAEHLRLKRFAVVGCSGGGPYAMACAYALPREVLSGVGLVASGPPWEAGMRQMSVYRQAAYWMANYFPFLFKLTAISLVGLARWLVTTRPVIRWMDGFLVELRKKLEREGHPVSENEEDMTPEKRRERLISVFLEPFAQGTDGLVQETQLLTQSWGFKFEDVIYDKVQIWHGKGDKNAPIAMIRYMAERLPHCELHEYEGNHYDASKCFDEILDTFVSADDTP